MITIHGSTKVYSVAECSAENFDEAFLHVTKGLGTKNGFFAYSQGDIQRFLLLLEGQPFCAARDHGDGGQATTLKEFFEPFLSNQWHLVFHEADSELVKAMAATWQSSPDAHTSPGLIDPATMLQSMLEKRHEAIVRVLRGSEYSFAIVGDGDVGRFFGPDSIHGTDPAGKLWKLLVDRPEQITLETFKNPTAERSNDWALIPAGFQEGMVRFFCMTAPHLVILFADKEIQRLPLKAERTTIGRDPTNTIIVDNLSVSRRHALVTFSKGRCTIQDLGSSNGTLVNGERITGPVSLADGQEAIIGKHKVRFHARAMLKEKHAVVDGLDKTVFVRMPDFADGGSTTRAVLNVGGSSVVIKKTPFTIGSAASNDLQLEGRRVRPAHAEVTRDERGILWITHTGGLLSNTWVNGQKVKSAPLQSGDLLKLGTVLLRFHLKQESAPSK